MVIGKELNFGIILIYFYTKLTYQTQEKSAKKEDINAKSIGFRYDGNQAYVIITGQESVGWLKKLPLTKRVVIETLAAF